MLFRESCIAKNTDCYEDQELSEAQQFQMTWELLPAEVSRVTEGKTPTLTVHCLLKACMTA